MSQLNESGAASWSGFAGRHALVNGVRLHYRLGGDPAGPPVLLWHGFLGTSHSWRKVAPALAAAGLSVLVPDMRGYGDSDKPEGDHGYDGRALADDFRSLIAHIGFGAGSPVTIIAHDMGAPAALIWAGEHPNEVASLAYIEVPVMLGDVLRRIIAYTPEAMARGSMWWWILPLAPDVPERLIVGNERAFLTWFFDRDDATRNATGDAVDEYLRTFRGREGVLGTLGVYRAAFATIAQTEALRENKVTTPVLGLGGSKGNGRNVGVGLELVAKNVRTEVVDECGHFIPEENPSAIIARVLAMTESHPPAASVSQTKSIANNNVIGESNEPE